MLAPMLAVDEEYFNEAKIYRWIAVQGRDRRSRRTGYDPLAAWGNSVGLCSSTGAVAVRPPGGVGGSDRFA